MGESLGGFRYEQFKKSHRVIEPSPRLEVGMIGRRKLLSFAIFFAVLNATLSPAGIASADEEGIEFFEKRIRPLLVEHCYECHGAEEQENELRLDQAKELFAGGKSGKAIVPGEPNASLLITAVRYVSDDLQMPPEGKLKATEIADLERWIEIGAPHPDGQPAATTASVPASQDWDERKSHWSFQPLAAPPMPRVNNPQWVQTSLDHFVLAALEAAELPPAAPADRATLIRRATFDLTGLPPTPEEVAAFVGDPSPNAFAKVVDRLLASPQYGQRWGRHWLDVARYADSNGLDENVAHGNAWRYRDWVIDSLNNDKPYDSFVREQLAGDLLPADDPRQRNQMLIATGFLSLGPKVLAEVDKQKMEMDIIDEQIDAIGRSLLGLTLGCARCHDHKFDAISTADYYALAGIFKSTHTMDSFATIARWHEHELHDEAHRAAKATHEQQLAAKKQSLDEMLASATAVLQKELGEGAALPAKPEESFPALTREMIAALRTEIAAIEKNAPIAPSAMGVHDATPVDVAIHVRGSHLTKGEIVPRGIPAVFRSGSEPAIASTASGRLRLAEWLTEPNHPLTARVMANRVWRWHFGRGLVASADNFGRMGSLPTNQALLDHLASEFSRDWSLKNLHRQIMLSATYQTSSQCTEQAKAVDPENRLYGRTSLRRLEAEEIRDAMLAVSNTLDPATGGPALATENRKHVFDHTSKDDTTYANQRRSVYLPVIRNHLHESFTLFDYSDASVPTGNRNTSTIASQALYLMNSDFVADAARSLAKRIALLEADNDGDRINHLYLLAYSRPATDDELARATVFLAQIEQRSSREQAWQLLCHNVLISNDFFYVR